MLTHTPGQWSLTEGIFADSLVPQPAVPAAQGGAGWGVRGLSVCSAVSSLCAQDALDGSAETNWWFGPCLRPFPGVESAVSTFGSFPVKAPLTL